MLDKTKTLTTMARQKKAKEKALKWSIQTGKEPYKNHSEKNRTYNMLKRTTKPLRRRVLIEEGLARISNKQHLENTDKWYLCKAGSFSYSESLWTPPLEGTSLHRWNNDVERPWGILSLFTTCLRLWVKSHCHLLPCLQNMPQKAVSRTCPKKQLRKKKRPTKVQNTEKKKLVSSRIFTFCQPYRVSSGWIRHSQLLYTRAKE